MEGKWISNVKNNYLILLTNYKLSYYYIKPLPLITTFIIIIILVLLASADAAVTCYTYKYFQ
jgi:hypothetical protein